RDPRAPGAGRAPDRAHLRAPPPVPRRPRAGDRDDRRTRSHPEPRAAARRAPDRDRPHAEALRGPRRVPAPEGGDAARYHALSRVSGGAPATAAGPRPRTAPG